MAFTLDTGTLQRMNMFERITHAKVKDSFEDDNKLLTFIVPEHNLAKALGKKAVNVKKLEEKMRKKVRIIEHNDNLQSFVTNVVRPNVCEVQIKDDVVVLVPREEKVRGNLIGRAARNLRNSEKIVQRYFPIKRMIVTKVQEEYPIGE